MLHRESRRDAAELWSARSTNGVIATAHYLATLAGVEILEKGGNAIDAAVAASLALGVCESSSSGLGGMAMMLVHLQPQGKTLVIEGACRAPRRATPQDVAQSRRYRGYRAVAVPTHIAVLRHALEHYGTAKRAEVLASAIHLAEEGFPLTSSQFKILRRYHRSLRRNNAGPFFLDEHGNPPAVGSTICQPMLARTLERLSKEGFEDFYHGEIAREICKDIRRHDGFVDDGDLGSDSLIRETTPIRGRFGGRTVLTLGPPAGGQSLIQMLHTLEAMGEHDLNLDSPEGCVLVAGIIRQARRDRRQYRLKTNADGMGEAAEMLDTAYAQRAAREVQARLEMTPSNGERRARVPPIGNGETSHISVMDRQGNAVAMTQSIERSFGAAVVTPSLGFLYNGYLRAFKVENREHPHYLRPGAPARSNAAPTILLEGERPSIALGSTGSERMASGIFEVLLRLRRQKPFDAVHAPRLHATPEDLVLWEADRFPPFCAEALRQHGFVLKSLAPYSFKMGGLQLVLRHRESFCGVADPRRDGAAGAPGKSP